MPASFPGAIKTFSAITRNVTVLEQALFDDPGLEVEAIETELGIGVHGTAGSLAERVNMAMDLDGVPRGLLQNFDATDTQRKRIRCGVTSFQCSDLSTDGHNLVGTITFDVPLKAACHAFVRLQLSESDPTLSTIPAFAAYKMDSGSTTGFVFHVTNGSNDPPLDTTGFILHWLAVEKDFSGTSTDL